MLKGIKVQIHPNKSQEQYLVKLFGCCRFVYNKSLEYKINEYTNNKNNIGLKELGKYLFGVLRVENEWLQEHNSKPLTQSILNVLEAYKRFFINHNGFPKFKSKHDRQSIRFPVDAISKNTFNGNTFNLTKGFKNIKFKCSQKYKEILLENNGKIKSATVSKNKAGKYFCSFLVEVNHEQLPKSANEIIALDLGIKSFLVSSDGQEITNPKFTRTNERKLKKLQRRLSKKQKGSKNREKARLKLAKAYYKINNQKKDFLHKLTTNLIKDNQIIGIEDLNVKSMLEKGNSNLAKSIQELSLNEFVRQLIYKAAWNNRLVVKVDKFFPSSKLCSSCKWKNTEQNLNDRTFKCQECNLEIDRDYNAALNIKQEVLKLIGSHYPESKSVENTR